MTINSLSKLVATSLLIALLTACSTPAPSAPAASEATTVPEPTGAAEPTEAAAETPATEASSDASTESGQPTGLITYVIIPEESLASYLVDEEFFGLALGKYGIPEGLVDTVGTTNAIEGQFELNWDDLSAPLGENTFTVDLSTLESNQGLRDSWIRENGPEFGTYPTATFVADSLEGAPTSYTPGEEVNFKMNGQMTIRETTQPVSFDITAKLEDGTVTGTAIADLKMTNFGITPPDFANTLTVSDDFQVKVDFTAQEQ
jgi:polyisoprenoid-binding protein YceI